MLLEPLFCRPSLAFLLKTAADAATSTVFRMRFKCSRKIQSRRMDEVSGATVIRSNIFTHVASQHRSFYISTDRTSVDPRPFLIRGFGIGLGQRDLSANALSSTSDVKWTVDSLKFEIKRLNYRTFNKISKLSIKLANLKNSISTGEEGGDINIVQSEINLMKGKLNELVKLENELKTAKGISPGAIEIARHIGLQPSAASTDLQAVFKKAESPRIKVPPSARKPYNIYTSSENIQIFVGRTAEDNDVLSTSGACRDPKEWWLHVAGYPGSHVVIKSKDDSIDTNHKKTLHEAALLTAHFSKCSSSNRVSVHYTRCHNVKKPPGAKPGLVQLSGYSGEIRVNLIADKNQLETLLKTKSF